MLQLGVVLLVISRVAQIACKVFVLKKANVFYHKVSISQHLFMPIYQIGLLMTKGIFLCVVIMCK